MDEIYKTSLTLLISMPYCSCNIHNHTIRYFQQVSVGVIVIFNQHVTTNEQDNVASVNAMCGIDTSFDD